MKEEPDPEYEGFHIQVYQRWFHCIVTFKIWHKTNKAARAIAEKLEYFMENYAGHFKENGVFQIKFKREGKPQVVADSRQSIPKRELAYDLYLMRTDVVRTRLLKDVALKLSVYNASNDHTGQLEQSQIDTIQL
jgi:hypothetical protein